MELCSNHIIILYISGSFAQTILLFSIFWELCSDHLIIFSYFWELCSDHIYYYFSLYLGALLKPYIIFRELSSNHILFLRSLAQTIYYFYFSGALLWPYYYISFPGALLWPYCYFLYFWELCSDHIYYYFSLYLGALLKPYIIFRELSSNHILFLGSLAQTIYYILVALFWPYYYIL